MRLLSMLLSKRLVANVSIQLQQSQRQLRHIHTQGAAAAVPAAIWTVPPCQGRCASSRQSSSPIAAFTSDTASGRGSGKLLPPLPQTDMGTASLPPLSLEETLQAVAIPPTDRNLGPRVEHVYVSAAGQLSDIIASALQLPQPFVLELMRFGAVHWCQVMPPPSPKAAPRMSTGHLQFMQRLRAEGITRHGKDPRLQVPRRCTTDRHVQQGAYVRVHVHPKRFTAAHTVDWRQRVLADRPEYVVVDKPAGVQVPPTVDNLLENVMSCVASALGLHPDALSNPHRLDVGTSGVVLLAKTQGFARWFSNALKLKPAVVVKTYRCLTAAAPPLGPLVHWAVVKQRQAGEPAHTHMLLECAVPDAAQSAAGGGGGRGDGGPVRCELIVEQVCRVELTGAAAAEWGPTAYETTLQLVTGRTHQIRAQMAAVGCPLLGDQLYTALAAVWQQEQEQQEQQQGVQQEDPQQQQQQQPPWQEAVGQTEQLQQQEKVVGSGGAVQQHHGSPQQQQPLQEQQQQHRHGGAHWSKIYQEDPSRPIGLQAAKLKVRNVAGCMTRQAVAGDGGAEAAAQPQGADAEEAGGSPQPEWVEFEAGVPWWRA